MSQNLLAFPPDSRPVSSQGSFAPVTLCASIIARRRTAAAFRHCPSTPYHSRVPPSRARQGLHYQFSKAPYQWNRARRCDVAILINHRLYVPAVVPSCCLSRPVCHNSLLAPFACYASASPASPKVSRAWLLRLSRKLSHLVGTDIHCDTKAR